MNEQAYSIDLSLVDEHGHATTHVLATGSYVVGRAEDCDVCFPGTALTVSRHHAKLEVGPERVAIEDLESRTGTMVNGRFVRQSELESGDVITLGEYTIRLDFEAVSRARKAALVVPAATETERDTDDLEADLAESAAATARILAEIHKRIVGQDRVLRLIWAAILTREHCLLVGVPGLAKTLMVTTFGEALGLHANRIQFTPDLMPSDIIGSNVIQPSEDGKRHFEFVQGPIFTHLLLADEINRTPPKTQSALLEAMQERQVTVGSRSLHLPVPFCVIATQNPIEQEGTYPLPEAQQDRFMLCVRLDYPSRADEIQVLTRTTQGGLVAIEQAAGHRDVLTYQKTVDRVVVPEELAAYAADLVRASRPDAASAPSWLPELVDWGAGPRAGQSLLRVAKALAAMAGRPAISGEDIRATAVSVLRHRICCNYRARIQGLDEDALITRLLETVPCP